MHRHFLEVGVGAVLGVQFRGALDGVGVVTEDLAHGRRARRQRTFCGMPVVITLTGDGALAANVQGGEGVHLTRVRDSDDHAVLLLDLGVGRRGLHAAELERRACVFLQVGQVVGGIYRFGRELYRRAAAHRAPGFGNGRAVFGDEHAGDAVVRAHAREVRLDHLYARRAAGANRRVQILDARFFQAKRPLLSSMTHPFVLCRVPAPLWVGERFRFQTMREY